jgi:hypothetical protein
MPGPVDRYQSHTDERTLKMRVFEARAARAMEVEDGFAGWVSPLRESKRSTVLQGERLAGQI